MQSRSGALELALQHHQHGNLAQARDIYCDILQQEPAHADAWHLLGMALLQGGEHQPAIECVEKAIAFRPSSPAYHAHLGIILRETGRLSDAATSLQRSLDLDPDNAETNGNLGVVQMEQGELNKAVETLRRAVRLQPKLALWHSNLGNAMKGQGKLADAVASYRQALQLQPDLVLAHSNLGTALRELGQWDEAEACYRNALRLDPEFAEVHTNLGVVLKDVGRLDEAVACHRRALELRPEFAEAHLNLGRTALDQHRADEADDSFREAIRIRPKYPEAFNNLGSSLMNQGELEEALACFRQTLEFDPDSPTAQTNLLLCSNYWPGIDPEQLYQKHRRWAQRQPHVAPATFDNDPNPDRCVRIGYVSSDFRAHPVARFFEPILACRNAGQVTNVCYANVAVPDDITARLQTLADDWQSISGLNDEQVAALIRSDEVDILVDLAGHTAGHRLGVFVHKPAPIQVTYLGYPNTTGLEAMDYRITDAVADPPDGSAHYVEELVRLPGPFCCFSPPDDTPDVTPLPAQQAGYVTFGSPHNLAKLNADVLDLWCRVLRELPTARLRIFRGELRGQTRRRIQERFTKRGIAAERIELENVSSANRGYRGYLQAFGKVDLCLDTLPGNAGTTAFESLWMGVPILTLYGDRFFGRMTTSFLGHVGLSEFAARSADEFVATAIDVANDLDRLAQQRAGLRSHMIASPLCDGPRFSQGLEDAYRRMWRKWCATTAHGIKGMDKQPTG